MISRTLIFIILTISSQVMASDILKHCNLTTNKPHLLKPSNKRVICNETFLALFPEVVREEYDYFLRIQANGHQGTYEVELEKIEAFIGNDLVFDVSGILHWNPDGSHVIINNY